MIIDNPVVGLLPEVKPNTVERPDDAQQSRQWESLSSLLLAFLTLLRIGEWHHETVLITAQKIPHRLGRKPRCLWFALPPDGNGVVWAPGGREAWDSRTITLQGSLAKGLIVEFLLF